MTALGTNLKPKTLVTPHKTMLSILRNIPVLCFHDIATPGGMSLKRFQDHLETIRNMGFQTISAQELLAVCLREQPLRDKPIVLTFDDCHVSNWMHAIPELERRGMRGIFFAVTDFVHSGPIRTQRNAPVFASASDSFKDALSKRDYSQFMTREELVSAVTDHGMEIYSHTARHQGCFRDLTVAASVCQGHWSAHGIYDHPLEDMPTFTRGSAYAYNGYWPQKEQLSQKRFNCRTDEERLLFCVQDFCTSLEVIKEINKEARQLICWPWGEFDNITIQAAKKAGFTGAFNLDRFYNGPGTDPFHLHRLPVSHHKSRQWLRSRLHMYTTRPGAILFNKFFKKISTKHRAKP